MYRPALALEKVRNSTDSPEINELIKKQQNLKRFQDEVESIDDQITLYIGKIRDQLNMKGGQREDNTDDKTDAEDDTDDDEPPQQTPRERAKEIAEEAILNAECFKATLAPEGNVNIKTNTQLISNNSKEISGFLQWILISMIKGIVSLQK